ncbi:MAG: transglycosylase SLT domain-containing protein [Deltaproteobacteria bacterium]|nr:transglycosylase SLT domain-containing protein [Deltaproteobacteria bacterium]
MALGIATIVVAALAGIGWRRSLSAAYRAFRQPELVEAGGAASPRRPARAEPPLDLSAELDRQLAADYAETDSRLLLVDGDADLLDLTPNDLPVPITRRALRYVRFFTTDHRGRRVFEATWRRSGRYRAIIERALRDAALPEDLVWLVAVESGFDPQATSPAQAAGLWQFMPGTAADRGLTITHWVDERRSLDRATRAAVTHLRELHDAFGSWDLALAAYNMGHEGLNQALARLATLRQQRNEPPQRAGVAQLAAEGLIPRETADYVPKITAMALVAANRAHFGVDGVPPDGALRPATILVPGETKLATVARAAGVPNAEVRKLNPQLLRGQVPPGADYEVAVPAARLDRALAALPVYLEDAEAGGAEPPEPRAQPGPVEPVRAEWQAAVASLDAARVAPRGLPPSPLGSPGPLVLSVPPLGSAGKVGVKPLEQLAGVGFGMEYRRDPLELFAYADDVLGAGWTPGPRSVTDPSLEKHLAFLREPAVVEETLGHGITLRMVRDTTMARVAVTVRLGTGMAAVAAPGDPQPREAMREIRLTEVVPSEQLDVGVTMAVGRLGLLLAEAASRPVAALRARLNRHRRVALGRLGDGEAWLALSKALFPPGDGLAGRLVGPRGADAAWLRDRLLLSGLAAERAPADATITVVGNVDPARIRPLVEQSVAELGLAFGAGGAGDELRPDLSHQTIETDVAHERLLLGWRVPGIEHRDHAAIQVTVELVAGRKKSLINRKLVAAELVRAARGMVDEGWAASVAVVEVKPSLPGTSSRVENRINELMERVAKEGPSRVELAYAKAMIDYRLKKRAAQLSKAPSPGGGTAPLGWRLLEVLRPGHTARAVKAIDEVDAQDVKRVLRQHLRRDQRHLVVAVPTGTQAPVAQR